MPVNEWIINEGRLHELPPPSRRGQGLMDTDHGLGEEMGTKCQPQVALGVPGLTIFIKVL